MWRYYQSLGTFAFVLPVCWVIIAETKSIGTECPANSYWGCLRTCMESCDKLDNVNPVCPVMCTWGCECKPGYILQSQSSKVCVPYSDCNVTCPPNMHFRPCSPHSRLTCELINAALPVLPTCSPQCFCDEGFAFTRDRSRPCIPLGECSKQQVQNAALD
ncbi:alpha-tectorin [Xenopus laevis]|uniref:Alpha-tectorin n=2 Tax=Xenopus laevis TaxID=8355 RepID=A0A1L8FPR2_XENLA|nr:alpha-tectorin [Xenopus laevis]OCT73563.1 hypothetical protein XELAEV_18036542mg [Xenopus laevis]